MEEREFIRHYEELKDTVYRIAFTYVKNTADALDIVQEVMLKLYRCREVFTDDIHYRQWVIRVTVNQAKDVLRSAWLKKREDSDLSLIPDLTREDHQILSLIFSLPQKYRSVIVLHYVEGYSYAETADILRISEAAAKMRAKRGRQMLKDEWKEGEDDEQE